MMFRDVTEIHLNSLKNNFLMRKFFILYTLSFIIFVIGSLKQLFTSMSKISSTTCIIIIWFLDYFLIKTDLINW